jgi:hypothetical protein
MSNATPYRRWYDNNPEIQNLTDLVVVFPTDLQLILAKNMASIAEIRFHAHELIRSLKSVGAENIQRLQKSSNNLRRYDRNPFYHRFMNYLLVLPSENRSVVLHDSHELVDYSIKYLNLCKRFRRSVNLEEFATVQDTFSDGGGGKVNRYLEHLSQKLTLQNTASSNQYLPENDSQEAISQRTLSETFYINDEGRIMHWIPND